MENGFHGSQEKHDVAQIVCGDQLVDATPEAIRDLAESAMLLSQGARRAIEMRNEARERVAREAGNGAGTPQADPATVAADNDPGGTVL
jgi:hypothetical protein